MLPSDSRRDYRFIAADATLETASRTLRRDPVWPTTAAAAMPELSVVVVANDNEQRTRLQRLVDVTGVARAVLTCDSFPVAASDPVTKRVQAANPEVILIDITDSNLDVALRAIELLHQELPDTAIFAISYLIVTGDQQSGQRRSLILKAMRAGAREFLSSPTTTDDLVRAFSRTITGPRPRSKRLSERGVHHRQQGQSEYLRVKADLPRNHWQLVIQESPRESIWEGFMSRLTRLAQTTRHFRTLAGLAGLRAFKKATRLRWFM